jgi:hypothetical protein
MGCNAHIVDMHAAMSLDTACAAVFDNLDVCCYATRPSLQQHDGAAGEEAVPCPQDRPGVYVCVGHMCVWGGGRDARVRQSKKERWAHSTAWQYNPLTEDTCAAGCTWLQPCWAVHIQSQHVLAVC